MHPAKGNHIFTIDSPYAAVRVIREGDCLTVDSSVFIVKADNVYTPIPTGFKVQAASGEEIQPSGQFLMSAETLDPYHIVIDWNGRKGEF
ncbi:hypothetical protein J2T17_006347 [Paenibacillus mucilaginosus]|uniref:hypothetical protein n=1 Tax=Paenibacillus mucilaginosus TaxID=61624 RepID=UPI003D1D359A